MKILSDVDGDKEFAIVLNKAEARAIYDYLEACAATAPKRKTKGRVIADTIAEKLPIW